jgi:hypothetical protein
VATVVTVVFNQVAVVKLVVEPEVLSAVPLERSELITGSDGRNNGGFTPGTRVPDEDDVAVRVAPVDLKLHLVEGESTEGGPSSCLTGVECTFEDFGLRSNE